VHLTCTMSRRNPICDWPSRLQIQTYTTNLNRKLKNSLQNNFGYRDVFKYFSIILCHYSIVFRQHWRRHRWIAAVKLSFLARNYTCIIYCNDLIARATLIIYYHSSWKQTRTVLYGFTCRIIYVKPRPMRDPDSGPRNTQICFK